MSTKLKRITGILLALLLVMGQFLTGITEVQAAAGTPKLNRISLTLTVGQSKKLTVSNAKNVKWRSSDRTVASVSKNGVVKAKKAGTATVTAKTSGKNLRCRVTVNRNQNSGNSQTTGNKILVAYFSWSGTSERIAKNIIEQTGADSYRIERKTPYSNDYSTVAYGEARTEAETNARPAIKNAPESIAQYDKIVLCYPIWWHTAPMTVGTFLEKYDFTGKTIYPVSQSASMDRSQFEESVAFVKSNAKGATVDDGLFTTNSSRITDYVNQKVLGK